MENVIISRNVIKGCPYYLLYKDNYKGVTFVLHGLTGNHKDGLTSAYKLALAGYLVVLPLAKWHGEERPDNFSYLFNGDNFLGSITKIMNDYIISNITILNHLTIKHKLSKLKIGCVGFSMGAYVTYLLPLFDKRFKTIIPISGSPYNYDQNAIKHFNINNTKSTKEVRFQAADKIESFIDLNILIIHNKDDETVSYLGSERFYNNLKPIMNNGEIKMILNQLGGHSYYSYFDKEVINWFDKHLYIV